MVRLLLPALLLLPSCQSGPEPSPGAPPVYQTLHHPKFKGAFFQLEYDGEQYLACSVHQAHLKPGEELTREGATAAVTVGKRVYRQKDLHLWTFESPEVRPEDLLAYRPGIEVRLDDRVHFLNGGRAIAATVVALPRGEQFRHTYRTDEPFAAAGLSGSPVYLSRTGTVIGVLQTANDRKKATFGGFEVLDFR